MVVDGVQLYNIYHMKCMVCLSWGVCCGLFLTLTLLQFPTLFLFNYATP